MLAGGGKESWVEMSLNFSECSGRKQGFLPEWQEAKGFSFGCYTGDRSFAGNGGVVVR